MDFDIREVEPGGKYWHWILAGGGLVLAYVTYRLYASAAAAKASADSSSPASPIVLGSSPYGVPGQISAGDLLGGVGNPAGGTGGTSPPPAASTGIDPTTQAQITLATTALGVNQATTLQTDNSGVLAAALSQLPGFNGSIDISNMLGSNVGSGGGSGSSGTRINVNPSNLISPSAVAAQHQADLSAGIANASQLYLSDPTNYTLANNLKSSIASAGNAGVDTTAYQAFDPVVYAGESSINSAQKAFATNPNAQTASALQSSVSVAKSQGVNVAGLDTFDYSPWIKAA